MTEVVYFNQLDQRYANQPYGTDNIGGYGCGPTAMSIVVSSLTDEIVDPTAMAKWAYENGGWCKGHFIATGHFIVLRGVQNGKILVADPASTSRSRKVWDLSIILNEAGERAGRSGS